MAEAGETTEAITDFITEMMAEQERQLTVSAEKHRRKSEEAQRREETQNRPPAAPSKPRPAAEGHGG